MELNLKFDTSSQKDLSFIKTFGAALQAASVVFAESTDDSVATLVTEPEVEKTSTPAPEPTPETPVEAPKKRSRKKVEEPKPEPVPEPTPEPVPEPTPEPVVEETPASDLPFEVEEPVKFPTMTKDEWSEVNHTKRAQLGLVVGGEHGDLIRDFNAYCQKNSEVAFANPKPSTLSEEELWQYAQWFKTIEINPDYIPGSVDEDKRPFVSDALSKRK